MRVRILDLGAGEKKYHCTQQASCGRGRGLPQRLPEPESEKYMDPEKSTPGTGERSKGNISGTLCKYLPVEELRDSEIDSMSDLSGDDDLF